MLTAQDSRHARLITGLKILLPLFGLGVLATIFLFPRQIDPTGALPYADVDVDALTLSPQVGAPRFASVTEDGTALTAEADFVRANPTGPGDWMDAERLHVILESATGQVSSIVAERGQLDRAGGVLRLTGAVHMQSAAGYQLWAEEVRAATDRTWVEGDGPVFGEGPPGQITAGGMVFQLADAQPTTDEDAANGGHLLVFTDGVKLLYLPSQQE